ncbi:hypothetical protein C7974DRAFT_470185 [Boeremia exigua]|uniref:uncharacterized protein n=1 Tax=Boeremia exigua TaxID=749465 RepID=UPI001E8D462B|nr:uncharacterized protein C7974DRAFT_470185 [Boeremia exigua]KAH6639726.1 hypothetical protein C7974DRAFT_470185 [Boeremia exigua]
MTDTDPPDRQHHNPDEGLVRAYSQAGTREKDARCPRCLETEPMEHRRWGAVACGERCVLCRKSGHKGKVCPLMTTEYNHVFGKTWLDEHWPNHDTPMTDEEISAFRQHLGEVKATANRKAQIEANEKARTERDRGSFQPDQNFRGRGDYRGRGDHRGRGDRGRSDRGRGDYRGRSDNRGRGGSQVRSTSQGSWSGYQDPRDTTDGGPPGKRRRREGSDDRGLAKVDDINPDVDPVAYLRQRHAKAKAASEDTVMGNDPNESLQGTVDRLQEQLRLGDLRFTRLQERCEKSRTAFNELQEDYDTASLRLETLSEQFQKTWDDNESLKKQLESANATTARVQEQTKAQVSVLEHQRNAAVFTAGNNSVLLGSREQELASLRAEFEQLRARTEIAESRNRDSADINPEDIKIDPTENVQLLHRGRSTSHDDVGYKDEDDVLIKRED